VLDEQLTRAIAQDIVNEAKRTARVDQGTLKRSIRYTVRNGVFEFRQTYYGIYGDNSQLEELVRKKMPNGTPYKIILLNVDGTVNESGKTKQGRTSQRSSIGSLIRSGTSKIKALISRISGEKEK
jgi:hypothetical protein